VAPHEVNESHIQQIEKLFAGATRYSMVKNNQATNTKVLIIDNIGMLSKLYHYATVTYIGGGFNKSGIHNTLEAAVYGKPVIFGPTYHKFKEARELIEAGAAFSISSAEELKIKMDHLFNDPKQLQLSVDASKKYVERNTGATQKIMQYIHENRLLTN
jgi:3-deoxy-D-manno-octulosonic-acid transferase